MMRFDRYQRARSEEIASLIHQAFASSRTLFPLNLLRTPVPFSTIEELDETLREETIVSDASFVAVDAERVVSAAIAASDGDGVGWWRIATEKSYRRQGLASECISRGEDELAGMSAGKIGTSEVVDSRWTAAAGLFEALGYELRDPQERNITMMAETWEPRRPQIAEGYEIDTLREDDIDEWTDVRNAIFPGDWEPDWFVRHFSSRPDFDPEGWFLARRDGRIVGMTGGLVIEYRPNSERLRGGQIEYVGVLEEHRRARLGEALMTVCMNYLADRGGLPTMLLTQPFRVPAIRLYEKLGFTTLAAWHRWEKALP